MSAMKKDEDNTETPERLMDPKLSSLTGCVCIVQPKRERKCELREAKSNNRTVPIF